MPGVLKEVAMSDEKSVFGELAALRAAVKAAKQRRQMKQLRDAMILAETLQEARALQEAKKKEGSDE